MHARSGVSEVALPDGTLTRESLVISNTFNNCFSSVFTNDDGNNPVISSKTSVEMPNIEFTPDTVFLTLLGLKSSLSAGPDGIPNLFLKNCASALATIPHIWCILQGSKTTSGMENCPGDTHSQERSHQRSLKTTDQYQLHHLAAELWKE